MRDLFERFDRLDTRLNQWLVAYSIPVLRIALGGIFLAFGVLKFFPGLSPIEDLATRTTEALSFGLVSGRGAMVVIAALECLIGLSFVTGRFLRVGVWLLAAQMLGAMSPLVLFPGELFPGSLYTPTLAAQYIIKDVVLVAAGMVIASTWTGARIIPERRSMRSTLGSGIPRMYDAVQVQRSVRKLRPCGNAPSAQSSAVLRQSSHVTESSRTSSTEVHELYRTCRMDHLVRKIPGRGAERPHGRDLGQTPAAL